MTPKNRTTIEPISHFKPVPKTRSRRMKSSMSTRGKEINAFRGKSPFRIKKPKTQRKSVIKVSTISYKHTPEKISSRRKKKRNKSIVNTRIESQKEFHNDTGSKLKKQIVYTKRGQEIMDSLINTGKARIADYNDFNEILKRKNNHLLMKEKELKDSPYHFSRKNLHAVNSRAKLQKKKKHKKYNVVNSKKKVRNMMYGADNHRRVKTNMMVDIHRERIKSPSPDNANDFGGFFKEKVTHERLFD